MVAKPPSCMDIFSSCKGFEECILSRGSQVLKKRTIFQDRSRLKTALCFVLRSNITGETV
jgi:hypothetical protein